MSYGRERYCLGQVFNGMVWELKNVRYVHQLKRNFISIGAMKALNLEVSIRGRVLKIVKGSIVVLKGV